MKQFFFILIIIGVQVGFAQTKIFKNTSGVGFEGEYDSTFITEAQIKDAIFICYDVSSSPPLLTEPYAKTPGDIDKLSLHSLNKEYKARLRKLKNLNLIKTPFWEELRQTKIFRTKEYYDLAKVTIQGYKNPKILKTLLSADSCFEFADAIIAGGEIMINKWKKLNEKQCKNNNNSEECNKIFLEKFNSTQRLIYAQVELMSFGWWNCAIVHCAPSKSCESRGEIDGEFKKLFKTISFGGI